MRVGMTAIRVIDDQMEVACAILPDGYVTDGVFGETGCGRGEAGGDDIVTRQMEAGFFWDIPV